MKKLVLVLTLMVAVSFAASATISNSMLVETVIHHTPTGFVPLHSGDGAGYYFWDSNESSDFAPTFSWIDCTGGTDTGLNADDGYVNATIPAAWKLYGTDFASGNTITVSSNGGIGMGAGNYLSSNNRDIPLDDSFNGLLALYWDDLVWYASDGAYVYLYTDTSGDDDLYVISYDDGKHYGGTAGELSFQMYYVENNTGISSINNTVVFQYLDCSSEAGSSATVGIENDAGDAAAKYSFDSASLSDDLAIIFIDAAYVDNYIGDFDLVAPADGSEAIDGTQGYLRLGRCFLQRCWQLLLRDSSQRERRSLQPLPRSDRHCCFHLRLHHQPGQHQRRYRLLGCSRCRRHDWLHPLLQQRLQLHPAPARLRYRRNHLGTDQEHVTLCEHRS